MIGTQGAKVQRWFKKGEEVQRWFKGEEVQKCTGAQVQAQQRCWCTGAGTEKVVQSRCRAGAEEQRYGGAEMQRCRGAQTQIDGEVVQRCRHGAVVQG